MNTNKSDSNYQLWMEMPQTPRKKKRVAFEIYWGDTLLEVRLRTRKRCNDYFTEIFFSLNFVILSTGLPRRQLPPKIAARWHYRLPMENVTAHYNSFVSGLIFVCAMKPKNASGHVYWGLKIILLISNMHAGFFS